MHPPALPPALPILGEAPSLMLVSGNPPLFPSGAWRHPAVAPAFPPCARDSAAARGEAGNE